MTDAIRYEKGQDNVVVLTMDMPGQSANTMNGVYREAMAKTIARLEAEKEGIAGVVLTSAKKTFFAGGDLNELIKVTKADAPAFYQGIPRTQGPTAAPGDPRQSRWSPRSTALRWAAAGRSAWPATTASPWTIPACSSACRR